MKVVFRVDASLQIGSGHVMRCLTLADALCAHGAECHFISRAHEGHMFAQMSQRGYSVHVLAAEQMSRFATPQTNHRHAHLPKHASWLESDWEADADETAALLKAMQPDWLVVDHYALDDRWETSVRPSCGKLMVIDDLADRSHCCDLLLDQNLGRREENYQCLVPASCQVLVGPLFALLRPEFSELRDYSLTRRKNYQVDRLLIAMGGVDSPNATCEVLRALKSCDLPESCSITVVMGGQARWLSEVRNQVEKLPWKTEVAVNIADMAMRMALCDFSIGAAGSTSWERCCLGVPTLMVVLAENQRAGAQALIEAGAAASLGELGDIGNSLYSAIYLLKTERLEAMSHAASRITDGRGTIRVVKILTEEL